MRSFVDRAFGDDPVQLAVKARDVDGFAVKDETGIPPVVDSADNPTNPNTDLSATFRHAGAQRSGESDRE